MVNQAKPRATTGSKARKKPVGRKKTPALDRQIRIQKALYEIADAASAVTDMQSFYKKLHQIVGKLMHASNFYVSLYDAATGVLTSPYFADEKGDEPPPPTFIERDNKSLRAHVLLTRKTLHLSGPEIEAGRLAGQFEPRGTPAEDWVGVPLKIDGQVIGLLTVQSYQKGIRYQEQDVQLLEFVARHIAVALTRARAIEETRQRNTELAIINSVQEGLASKLEIQSIYELVGEKIRSTFDAQVVSIDTYEHDTQTLHSRYYFEDGKSVPGGVYPCFGFRKHAIENRRPLVLNSDLPRWMAQFENPVYRGSQPRSAVFIPMIASEEAIGVISLQNNDQENAFTEADVRVLTTLAGSMSVALENARLFDESQRLLKETQQRNAELAIINSIQAGLASQLDIQRIYELVGDKIREIFDANTVVLATFDLQKNLMFRHYLIERGKRFQVDPGPIPATWQGFIQQGQSTLINDNLLEFMQRIDPAFEVPIGEIPKSALSVPLRLNGAIRGVISLQNVDRENIFSDSDLRLLETLANSLSVALENARLFEETQQRNEELAIINSVQEGLASRLDMPAIYELIGEKVREVFHVEVIDIVNYDPVANLISMPYSYEKGDRSVFSPREPYGFRRQVIESRAPLLINQNFEQLASQSDNPLLTGAWPKSALFVPLLLEGQVRSIISIQDLERENAFSASDVQLLETLSNAMAVALENARLFDETERLLRDTEQRAQELATINTVGSALAGELDLDMLIQLVGNQIRSVFKADIAFLALLDGEKGMINFPYQYGQQLEPIQLGQGLTSRIIQSGQPLLINEEMDRQRQRMRVKLIGKRARSFLGVPIFVAGEAIGVVSVQSTKREGRFQESDQRLLSTMAANVGIALQNARLFQETQRLFHAEQLAHEQAETLRSVAQALNRSLSLTEVFQLVLTEIQKVIPYDSAGIYQVHGNRRVFVAGRGFANLEDLIGVSFEFNQQEDEIGFLISRSLQPLILADARLEYPQYFSTGTHAATKIRSYMAVPIVLGQKLIGMITLDREEQGFYTEAHARLAMAFAAQAATAINNAQLFDETQQRNAELAIINSVQEGLAASLDMQAIYRLVGDKIRETFAADTTFIVFKDEEEQLLLVAYYADRRLRRSFRRPYGTGIAEAIIESGKPLLLGSSQEHQQYGPHHVASPGTKRDRNQSVLGVPIFQNGKAYGAVSIQSYKLNAFDANDLRLLQTLVNSMSVALENARLFDETQRLFDETQQRNAELTIINSVQEGLASKLDMQAIYDLVGDKIREIFDANTVALATFDLERNSMHRHYVIERQTRYYFDPMPIPKVWRHFIQRDQSVLMKEDFMEVMRRIDPAYSVPVGEVPKSVVSVPLRLQGETRGVISLQNVERESAFSESDLRLLETLANSMSVALENARLWEQEKLYRKALERELEIGREIQAGFLPEVLPQIEGWEIAASLMSAREVAGDFYDAFEFPDGTIGLVIADVCGKGVGAALFMTLFRSLIRVTANQDYFEHMEAIGASTAERLQRAVSLTNNYIAETHETSAMFATLFFCILDPRDGKLAYINGGHEPPLIVRSGTVREILRKTGPAVGAVRNGCFDVLQTRLFAGDILFAYTDGVLDCKNPRDEFFGRQRVFDFLQRTAESSQELVQSLQAELQQFNASATQFDDITLLAIRRM